MPVCSQYTEPRFCVVCVVCVRTASRETLGSLRLVTVWFVHRGCDLVSHQGSTRCELTWLALHRFGQKRYFASRAEAISGGQDLAGGRRAAGTTPRILQHSIFP